LKQQPDILKEKRALVRSRLKTNRGLNRPNNRVVRKLQFLNNNRLKTAKCIRLLVCAFCKTCETTNRVVEQVYFQMKIKKKQYKIFPNEISAIIGAGPEPRFGKASDFAV
jgi:hypothetical protein